MLDMLHSYMSVVYIYYYIIYEKQLVHDFIQLNSTCLAIQSIFPFFYAFLNLLDALVTRASQIFARIRLPSLIQNFILLNAS